MGNTALTLQAKLNHSTYRHYELEQDNKSLRLLYGELKAKYEGKA